MELASIKASGQKGALVGLGKAGDRQFLNNHFCPTERLSLRVEWNWGVQMPSFCNWTGLYVHGWLLIWMEIW